MDSCNKTALNLESIGAHIYGDTFEDKLMIKCDFLSALLKINA